MRAALFPALILMLGACDVLEQPAGLIPRWTTGQELDEITRLLSGPNAAFRCVANAQKFTAKELARDLELLFQTDIRLKSSGNTPRIVMERLILGLCGQ